MSEALQSTEAVFRALIRPKRRAATPTDLLSLEGATRLEVAHAGMPLAVWAWGKGPPVWLLHGWESRASHMAAYVEPLVRAGYQAIAFDAPAHGESEGEETHAVDFGRAVLSLAETIGPPAATIGHSMGSVASLYAFAQGLKVEASIHLSGPSSMEPVLRRLAAAHGLEAASIAAVLDRIAELTGISLEAMSLAQLAQGLRHRALILHDPEDAEIPYADSFALAGAWPGSVLVPVQGVGHRRILRDAFVVESSVAFLSSIDDGRRGSGRASERPEPKVRNDSAKL